MRKLQKILKPSFFLLFSSSCWTANHQQTCQHFDCEDSITAEGFGETLGRVNRATHFLNFPIREINDPSKILGVLKILKTENENDNPKNIIYKYYCCLSENGEDAHFYYTVNNKKVHLRVTIQDKLIQEVYNIDNPQEPILQTNSDFLGKRPEPFELDVASAIGIPEAHFSMNSNGQITINTTSVLDGIHKIIEKQDLSSKTLLEIQENIKNQTKTNEDYFNTIPSTITNAVNSEVQKTLNMFQQSSGTNLTKELEKTQNHICNTLVCQKGEIKKDVNDAQVNLTNKIKTFETDASQKISDLQKDINENISTLGNTLSQKVTDAQNDINENVTQSNKTLSQKVTDAQNNVNQNITTLDKTLSQKVTDAQNNVNQNINVVKNNIIQCISGTLNENVFSKTEGQNLEKNLKKTIQNNFNTLTTVTQHIIKEESATVLQNLLNTANNILQQTQDILGIKRNEIGEAIGGNFLERLEQLIRIILDQTAHSEETLNAINVMTQILQEHGTFPLHYLGSIEYMLYGCSKFSKVQSPFPSIENYISQFGILTSTKLTLDFQEKFQDIAQKIEKIMNFITLSDVGSINIILPLMIKVFGTQFPIYDSTARKISQYCLEAHFTDSDFGLYGWIKDVYNELNNMVASSHEINNLSQNQSQQNKNILNDALLKINMAKKHLNDLLEGKVEGKYVIPASHFCGLQNYPNILKECVDIIEQIQKQSPIVRLEKITKTLEESINKNQKEMSDKIAEIQNQFDHILNLYFLTNNPFSDLTSKSNNS